MKKVLVTGGTGYIASHTVVEMISQGLHPVLLDNFTNSSSKVLDRLEQITGQLPDFVEMDIGDKGALSALFEQYEFSSVVHFAGLKAVGESVEQPLRYYQENLGKALTLFDVMQAHNCHKIVFSSSATVYGDPVSVPVTEEFALGATNPYGSTKLMIEEVLRDLAKSCSDWQVALLRYFNPVAAHPSGLIGEDPNGIPNNLMPYIAQVSVGKRQQLSVFGGDYPTRDGTGVRDYIHVVDLAAAHVKALAALQLGHGCQAYNLGTGQGYSVLEMVAAFEKASGRPIPYEIVERRAGDIAQAYADPRKAREKLGWQAQYDLDAMMRDHWRWQSQNPDGYGS